MIAATRPAAEIDVTLLVIIAALALAGAVALVYAVLTDPGPDLPEFEDLDGLDDLDDGHGPRSVR